jgi:hypothetical protein
MRRQQHVILLMALLIATTTSGRAQAPQPSADAKRLAMLVGTFEYEGASVDSPVGPAAKMVGKMTGRLLGGGAALEVTGTDPSGPFGGIQWGEVHTWDPSQKVYRLLGYQSDGQLWHGTSTVSGNVWRFTTTWVIKGTAFYSRVAQAFSADGRSYDWKSEVSTDGKTWVPFAQQKGRKVSP